MIYPFVVHPLLREPVTEGDRAEAVGGLDHQRHGGLMTGMRLLIGGLLESCQVAEGMRTCEDCCWLGDCRSRSVKEKVEEAKWQKAGHAYIS